MQGASEVSNFISFESLSAMEFRDPIMFINFFKTNNKFLKKKIENSAVYVAKSNIQKSECIIKIKLK